MGNPLDPGYYCSEELRTFGFARVGENVRIAKNCVVIGPENIEIGDNVRVDAFTSLLVARGRLTIGNSVHIHTYCMVGGRGGVSIEDYAVLSHGVRVLSATDPYDGTWMAGSVAPAQVTLPFIAPVRIARHALIGCGSTIMPGANVEEGAAIGAGGFVSQPAEAWSIYVGTPARKIKERGRRVIALEASITVTDSEAA